MLEINMHRTDDPLVRIWQFKIPLYVHPGQEGAWPYSVSRDLRIHQQIGELAPEVSFEVTRTGLRAEAKITVPDAEMWSQVEAVVDEIIRKNFREGETHPGAKAILVRS